ncbi:MAG: hypothetical protein GQF41_1346 [Candidatus Rifleibacterium amylolyticum]|nr:MAG: hypothetical protein GQF41_1346 [Candidatus Rifleibacterium amylolyticum]NLF95187.1 ferritin family protein [Candidatus Riflebacteria bacterium]
MKINADELMELAIQIEKNGKEYFSAMAERSENPKVKQIFNFLVREEQSHLEIFMKVRERLAEKQGEEIQVADEYNTPEMSAYIQAMSDGRVFPNLQSHSELASEIRDDKQAIYHAIGFEKDTVLFFSDILGILGPNDENRSLIEELIRQEKIHIAKLHTLLSSLK